jgi:hypothetical protein
LHRIVSILAGLSSTPTSRTHVLATVDAVAQNDEAIKRWRTGPVAVTRASGQVGTPLRRRLGQLPNDVRPLGRDYDLAAAFGDADAVAHLAGTLQPHKRRKR